MSKYKTAELLKELDKRIDKVQSSDEFKEVLEFFSKFHNYSYHNSILIMMQKPEATLVAGYKQWQKKFNRHVKKGEKGIAILAPFSYKKKISKSNNDSNLKNDDEREVIKTYFRPVYVFDVSQTSGKALPQLDLNLENSNSALFEPLKRYAISKGIKVQLKSLRKGLDGYSRGGEIVVNTNTNLTEKASILAHEIAHELLHFRENKDLKLTKEIIEMEAESVAFVVMNYFGIEIKSDEYLALYKKSYNLMESLKRISDISSSMIDYVLESKSEIQKIS
ncbi:MAG: ArdC-like ssDNA-binding domain-containing protein [bacterium]